ncbi:GNAT family N-acetyltransferase [Pontimicrobium sp. MEBiC01747]
MIELKKTTQEDLETLFVFQTNSEAIWLAAFTAEDPCNKDTYMEKWSKIVENPNIKMETLWVKDTIVGSVIHFDIMGETNISYWIDKKHWGKGYATIGLKQFITLTNKRPLFARVAFDNYASQKVLEKSGFKSIGKEKGFANARKKEIEEFVYRLEN